ncbi:hypothetical protein GCM10007416_32230 [Kroppenstedtia guangzhouensis]|uniref:Uncharacterized protein n=1 Tax=Kroppenstedtia guangzhouensis TaxID=1274356 RepID=A0ABQ1H2H5_9BACL|nr:hypothetical protein GCM10007416_32230 [Kroppenstedtia guangzhouensis]
MAVSTGWLTLAGGWLVDSAGWLADSLVVADFGWSATAWSMLADLVVLAGWLTLAEVAEWLADGWLILVVAGWLVD